MNVYDYDQQIISDLGEIDDNSNNFYTYRKLNFLSKLNRNNRNIAFIFHGAIQKKHKGKYKIVFRGYNYTIENTDIICISDYLLDKYSENYIVNWTLRTRKHSYSDSIYIELIRHIINSKEYDNVVFTGTSAGGFPSIKFASIFNKTAIISNSQLYIENYTKNKGLKYIQDMIDEDDVIIYKNRLIEDIVLESTPEKIVYYQNIADVGPPHNSYKDFLQFKTFINQNNLDKTCVCEFISFKYKYPRLYKKPKSVHTIQFPNNDKHLSVLRNYFKKTHVSK